MIECDVSVNEVGYVSAARYMTIEGQRDRAIEAAEAINKESAKMKDRIEELEAKISSMDESFKLTNFAKKTADDMLESVGCAYFCGRWHLPGTLGQAAPSLLQLNRARAVAKLQSLGYELVDEEWVAMDKAQPEERSPEPQKEVDETIKRMEESYKIMFGSGVPYLPGRDGEAKFNSMGERTHGSVESTVGFECGQNIHLHIPEGMKTKVEQTDGVTVIKIKPND